jgi:LSD1 subclass zinc finger protein
MSPTTDRWNIFLNKIQEKGNEFFATMREQALPMLKKNNGNPMQVGTALHAIHLQLLGLDKKIDDTWGSQVEAAFNKENFSDKEIDNQRKRGVEVQYNLHREFKLLELDINYQMAHYILALADEAKREHMNCSQCSAPLNIPEHTYTAEHITCQFCQTINTYEPGTYQRMVGTFCAEHLARWKSQDLLMSEIEIESQLASLRDGAYQKGKQQLRKAHQAYSEKYLAELKKYKPNLNVEKELDIAMQHF